MAGDGTSGCAGRVAPGKTGYPRRRRSNGRKEIDGSKLAPIIVVFAHVLTPSRGPDKFSRPPIQCQRYQHAHSAEAARNSVGGNSMHRR